MLLIFHTIFYQPLYNLLIFTYNEFPLRDFGIAVILVTIVVKLILYPFSLKSIKAQRSMLELQPKINSIRERFKNDKQGQAQQLMALYKDHKVNPFSSCLPLIIQLPFLFSKLIICSSRVFLFPTNSSFFSLYISLSVI